MGNGDGNGDGYGSRVQWLRRGVSDSRSVVESKGKEWKGQWRKHNIRKDMQGPQAHEQSLNGGITLLCE
jgi:hypothetical protein